MTILTDDEKIRGFAEIAGKVVTDDDVQYFRDKLIRGLKRGAPATSLEKIFKQLALMEDAIIIYHEKRSLTDD